MIVSRRHLLVLGGGVIATLTSPARARQPAGPVLQIIMRGTARGEHVWFSPMGVAVNPGTHIQFVNQDPGNSHTSTAYHPDLLGRQRRIPAAATPWDSDYLLPGQSFEVTLTAPGVYDYFCQPHEMAAMVGRIVVGRPDDPGWEDAAPDSDDLPAEALAAFPAVAQILASGSIEDTQAP